MTDIGFGKRRFLMQKLSQINTFKKDPFDRMHEECGISAVFGHSEASRLVYLSLYALQHRGQEAAGIVTANGTGLHQKMGLGLVADVFDQPTLDQLPGSHAIGHVRYSTSGDSSIVNCQPITVMTSDQPIDWDVAVSLSDDPPFKPPRTYQVDRTHPNGGTFDALLPLRTGQLAAGYASDTDTFAIVGAPAAEALLGAPHPRRPRQARPAGDGRPRPHPGPSPPARGRLMKKASAEQVV